MDVPPSERSAPVDDREDGFPWRFTVLLSVAAALWGGWWLFTASKFKGSWPDAGPFGDAFGGVNALFSAFAFAGIIYTILLQRKELRYQRWELAATREEIAGQREQMISQNATLVQQQFDSMFFQMLRLHHDIVNGMVYQRSGGGRPIQGRQVFGDVRSLVRNALPVHLARKPIDTALADMWDHVYQEFQAYLGHYFRNYYHLIKLVHEADQPLDKRRYTALARAQLSTDEHVALFYNAIGRIGRRRFKALIEEYHLLENLHLDAITEPAVLARFRRSAYGDDVGKVEAVLSRAGIEWPDEGEPSSADDNERE